MTNWQSRDAALAHITQEIRRVIEELRATREDALPLSLAAPARFIQERGILQPSRTMLWPSLLRNLVLAGLSSFLLVLIIVFTISHFVFLRPSVPMDLSSLDLHLTPQCVKQMQVNQISIVSVVLSSSNENVPLSAVNGSVVEGQSMPLGTLLGKQNTPCAAASLTVDQTAFRVQPSQPQEYSLEQSQITWIWSVTPLGVDAATSQKIPVRIPFSGKSHCGSGEALTGPYPLAGNFSLLIRVDSPSPSPAQETPLALPLLPGILSPLLIAFFMGMSIFLWRRRRKKGKRPGKALETKGSHIDPPDKASMADQPEVNNAQIALPDRFVSSPLVSSEVKIESLQQIPVNASVSFVYCYAREDKALRDQPGKHLSPLERLGQIITWHDSEIIPGTLWNEEITTRLNAAHVILLLISPDFVASDYCYSKEMAQAIERHRAGKASVIPIILRPVRWQETPIGKLQVLPADGRPVSSWPNIDDAFYDVVQDIRLLIATLPMRS